MFFSYWCGLTPLHEAARQVHYPLVKYLVEHGAKLNPLTKGVLFFFLLIFKF